MKLRTATVVLALFLGCGGSTEDAAPNGGPGTGGAGVSGAAGGAGVSGTAGSTGGAGAGAAGSTGAAANDASQTGGASGTAGASSGGNSGATAIDGGGTTDTGGAGSGGDRDGGTSDGGGDICSLPPETGACLALIPRFYFDPDTAQCRQFSWGGCGGNANKFETREACQAACEHRADSCRPEGNCRACPVTSDANGQFCAFWGLECAFGPRCGGVVCVCSSNANPRSGEWRCTTPPC
jgi:hypothetical protein